MPSLFLSLQPCSRNRSCCDGSLQCRCPTDCSCHQMNPGCCLAAGCHKCSAPRQRCALARLTDVVDCHLFAGAILDSCALAALDDALTEVIARDAYAQGIFGQVVRDGIAPGGFDGNAISIVILSGIVAPDLIVVGMSQQTPPWFSATEFKKTVFFSAL